MSELVVTANIAILDENFSSIVTLWVIKWEDIDFLYEAGSTSKPRDFETLRTNRTRSRIY